MSDDIVLLKYTSGVFKEGAPRARVWRAVLTSGVVDADHDRINASGVVLTRFLENPVALLHHNARSFPIGKWQNVRRVGEGYSGRIEAELHMVAPGILPEADTAAELIASKILNAVSIGFLPLEPGVPNKWGGFDWPSVELLEASVVTVGSNPQALLAAGLGAGGKGGSRPEPVLFLAPSSEPTYAVDPAMIGKMLGQAIRAEVRAKLCEAGGRLDSTDEDVAAVLSKLARHRGAGAVDGLRGVLGGAVEPATPRDLAPAGETFRSMRDALRPVKMPEPLVIPQAILQRVTTA